jgi:hypothetical protein
VLNDDQIDDCSTNCASKGKFEPGSLQAAAAGCTPGRSCCAPALLSSSSAGFISCSTMSPSLALTGIRPSGSKLLDSRAD